MHEDQGLYDAVNGGYNRIKKVEIKPQKKKSYNLSSYRVLES
jgi:hypothetical protein